MFLVDSNVLLDIVKKDPRWGAWSEKALAQAVDTGPIAINQLIYAEVSVAYERCEQLDSILGAFEIAKLSLPWDAAFLAGKAFLKYRRRAHRESIRVRPASLFSRAASRLPRSRELIGA